MNQISAFEYVTILVSIILGLGITQILTALSDLLNDYKTTRFYWPQLIWVLFILFLHIQDWFITYQLKSKPSWHLAEVIFLLLYPVVLFVIAKIILPEKNKEGTVSLRQYYYQQSRLMFLLLSVAILLSVLFNLFILNSNIASQWLLLLFLLATVYLCLSGNNNELVHQLTSIIILLAAILSVVYESNSWVIA